MKRAQGKSNIDIIKGYVAGERPFLQVGYTGDADKYIIRKEGETWTDASGKQWIQTASGPQAVTRIMDIIREEYFFLKFYKMNLSFFNVRFHF